MKADHILKSIMVVSACSGIAALGLGTTTGVAAGAYGFNTVSVGAYGGEPSITSDSKGVLYEATPSGGAIAYRSTNHGATWTQTAVPDTASGDDCLTTDQSNALYLCNLAGSQGNLPLQADSWKSTNKGSTWVHGAGSVPQCGSTSCNVFGVDRDWEAAATLKPYATTDTKHATVVLMYHDFYGPSHIWVNISTDGGLHFGLPVEVLSSPGVTPGAVAGTLEAEGYTFCNTVPAGVGIVKQGLKHAGRIYVGWIAADLPQDALGCNITQLESFHTLWVSWSDDGGKTWTPQMAFDAGIGHDSSTPFVSFTLDNQGNPYFGFAAQGPNDNPAVCAAESTAGTVQKDSTCQYNMYVIWSKDGGATWDGGGGTIPGSAAKAYEVNSAKEVGTHFFPAIAAGLPGHVSVAYLYTPEILPTDAVGKADPGGCAGPQAPGNPSTYPPTCKWYLIAAQTSSLGQNTPGSAGWQITRITKVPMHVGDICNLGIFCLAPASNRNLLDFIQVTLDPTTGCAHIGYSDDNTLKNMRAANQTGACFAPFKVASAGATPALAAALFVPGTVAAGLLRVARRRSRSRR